MNSIECISLLMSTRMRFNTAKIDFLNIDRSKRGNYKFFLIFPLTFTKLFPRMRPVLTEWALSSVGRASPLQGEGQWFEPTSAHHSFFFSLGVASQINLKPADSRSRVTILKVCPSFNATIDPLYLHIQLPFSHVRIGPLKPDE